MNGTKVKKRVVKNPDVRRKEIINSALILFEKNGYSNTSVEQIIQQAQIAKGTFYYYFKTKYDILKAIVEHIGVQLTAQFNHVASNDDLTVMEKLELMLTEQKSDDMNIPLIMKIIHKPENRELQEQLNIYSINNIAPIMANVFRQGYDTEIFSKSVSDEDMQLMLSSIQFIFDSGLFEWSDSKKLELLKSATQILEFICGAKKGQFDFIFQGIQ